MSAVPMLVCRGLPRSYGDRVAVDDVAFEVALYPDLTAVENLSFWGRLQGLTGRRLAARVGVGIGSMKIGEPNLEGVFLQLTGRTLRD